MAIKDRKKSNSEEAVQNKVKGSTGNQIIVIDDSDDGSYSDLQRKVKMKKKKQLVKEMGSEKKGAKKKKKVDSELKNKACANLPIITESYSDSKLLKETEKISGILKKKGDRRLSREREGYYEEPSKEVEEQQGARFLTGKARKRNIPHSSGGDDEFTAKKERKREKKRKHNPVCSSGLHCRDIEDESKKQISQEMLFPNRKRALTQNAQGDSAMIKKKKVACCLTSMGDQKSSNGISDNGIVADYQLQEGQSCKGKAFGCKQHQEDVVCISDEESKLTKKKKKKNRLEKKKVAFLCSSADNQVHQADVSDENLRKAKSKKKQPVVGKGKTGLIPDSKGASRVTKKKKTQVEIVKSPPALSVDDQDESTNERESAEKRRKKETKRAKGAQNGTVRSDDGRCENGSKRRVKKRKDRDHEGFRDPLEEPTLKKARIKAEAKGKEDEIKVVAFKKGNCDEINVDKMRRQALQEEIDRESGKTQAIKEEGDSDDHFGQWSTATFENSERKAKFLRLLGGFQKGPASAQDSLAQAPKPNMALGKSQERNLQRDLQAEFEKAVELKHRRGLGLGFQPAPQKSMRIDKYASKSVKFEV